MFRSQTSDNMDRWKRTAREKLRHEESQKGKDKRWRRSQRETARRDKVQLREKVRKSRNTVFLQRFVAPDLNNCTPLWREAHVEIKVCKTRQGRITFGS